MHFKTQLNFFHTHLGIKPGKIHLVLGIPGGGKSTTRNTIISDFVSMNPGKKVLLHLSEESYDDYKKDLIRCPAMVKHSDKIIVYSEQNHPEHYANTEIARARFEANIIQSNCDLVLYDNITTSKLYGGAPWQQEKFQEYLKPLMSETNIPIIVMAHTNKNIKAGHKGIIDQNDVRGSGNLTNIAEFLYILQTFVVNDKVHTTIRNVKHRGTEIGHKLYVLDFDNKTRIYKHAFPLDFEVFKKLYKKQHALA